MVQDHQGDVVSLPPNITTATVNVDAMNATIVVHVVAVGGVPVVTSSSNSLQSYYSDPITVRDDGPSVNIQVPAVGQDAISAPPTGWYYVFEVREQGDKFVYYKYFRPEKAYVRSFYLANLPSIDYRTPAPEGSAPTQLRVSSGMVQWQRSDGTWEALVSLSTLEGPPGASGTDGRDGSNGTQGPPGPSGPRGNPGSAGVQGVPGPQGEPGVDGSDGGRGPMGPAGPAGTPGTRGEQGDEGPQGPVGADGPAGPRGIQGADGPAGPAGGLGPRGLQGELGPEGPQGKDGAPGGVGAQGPLGPRGEAGPAGPTGPAGPKGNTGTPGADSTVPGPKGDTGAAGPKGDTGTFSGTTPNDVEVSTLGKGVVIKSPNGTRWRLHVTDAGATMWESLN